MDVNARKQYLETLLGRYLRARKRQKGVLLDEIGRTTGQNRKYTIRKLRVLASGTTRMPRKRPAVYGREVRQALEKVWTIYDFPCGQRLSPILRTDLQRLREWGELPISNRTAGMLIKISPATIDRLLMPVKEAQKVGRRYRPKSSGLLAKRIPLRLGEWQNARVGEIDMDLVLHCGATVAGDYGHSLSTLDVFTGWWEGDVVMGRAQVRIFNALKEIETRFPFPWRSVHSDNDNAFINEMLLRYTEERRLAFTRSRAYHKNDNARVEQKNYTHVRKPLGYLRYDTPAELQVIGDLYRHELRLYKNFFQPVMKLIRKERVGGRVHRVYDVPRTPYQRLIESGCLSKDQKRQLQQIHLGLNPADLKRRIDEKLAALFRLYEKKTKRSVVVDPYKKQEPSMVTFLMSDQDEVRLPT